MSSEIELVSDGEGIAVFGDPHDVERFLLTAGVTSRALAVRSSIGSTLSAGSGAAQAGSQIAANSGRWVKLTEESAKALKHGQAMKGSSDGVSRAIITTAKGKTSKILEFIKPGSFSTLLTNPAMLAGVSGLMAQLAMQQAMEEITQYLASIDAKVDDVLRAQKDAALAEMIGVGLVIDDAMLKREHVGRVSEVTWSSLHGAAQAIATAQSYALRRLDALAEKLEQNHKIPDLLRVTGEAEREVEEWLSVLARCVQLQDGLAVLELDRVLDSSPDELDRHREAINAGRHRRRDLIAASTHRLLERMDAASGIANTKVLLNPIKANAIVRSGNEVGVDVATFNTRLGITQGREALEARRWSEAVGDMRDGVVQTAEAGASATARFGAGAFAQVREFTTAASAHLAERLPRKRDDSDSAAVPELPTDSADSPAINDR